VDPGDEPDRILDLIGENNFKVKYIICTHSHFDHIAAIPEIKEAINPQIVIHQDDLDLYLNIKTQAALWGYPDIDPLPKPDVFVSEEDVINIGALKFTILHTPGHSPGGICMHGEGIVITGDTLFAGSVGRTDLHGGDIKKLKESFQRLLSLPNETQVLPGHGPETTIGKEKIDNFFND
jgi:glyoxylase-like metal-dependent hydrolase (beta-lactamase superfamily II)